MDVRVVDTDAQSYLDHSLREVLNSPESEKRRKYVTACQERRGQFTPLCFSVEGMWGGEAEWFIKPLAEQLTSRWAKPYSLLMVWLRARMTFAILHTTILCMRSSGSKWRCISLEDEAPPFGFNIN